MNTHVPDEKPPILNEQVRTHLGKGLRVMYQKEAPILPSDEIDYKMDCMESAEGKIVELRDRMLSPLGSVRESSFAAHGQVFLGLAQLVRGNRIIAFRVLSCMLIEFGQEIKRWGGWPKEDGMSFEERGRFWSSFADMNMPNGPDEWQQFFLNAGSFAYALMMRNENNPAFWDKLSTLADGPFQRAVDVYRRSL